MKKILCLMLLLFVLVACKEAPESELADSGIDSPAKEDTVKETETAPQTEPAPVVSSEPQTGESKAETAPQPETKTAVTDVDPKLRDLLKRADEKVTSLSYLYGGSETGNLFLDTYHLKSGKMKIKKYEENYYVRDGYYDTIYFDEGIGCCEERSRCVSHNVDNMNRTHSVDVSMLRIPKTPYQWLKEVNNAMIIGPETIDERSVTHIRFTDSNGQLTHMWIDDNYGIPHRVIVTDRNGNDIKYQFNDVKFNQLKDVDFAPPCAKK